MYLQSLEINGFKSFAKKGSFSFNSRISGIVGPNGSGKSNVAEAFRFVLGEQSLKNMRSKKGTDLLFAGQNGQVNRASVAVTFDNKNRLMDIDYKTVTVERVLSRDGSNEYLINGNKVRAKDVTELLASANVGSTGHHIISQGEADKILMINARDRRQVIEDALGLKVFTIKKNEAERKLIKVGENLAEVKIQERTITPRIAYLKREVEKIEKTRAMREELRDLYKQYLPGKQQVVQTIETINTAIAEQEKQINGIDQQINALRAEQQNAASDAGRAEKQKQLHDQKDVVNGIRTQRREHERNLGRIDAEISALEQQKREVELFNEQLESAGSTATERADTLSAEMHKTWMAWAQEIMDSENLSSERVTRWKNMMVDYAQLSDSDKQKDRNHVNNILAALGEEIVQAKTFDDRMISGKQNERVQIETQIIELQSREQTEQQTLDEFELEMGSPEVAVQKIQIQILEHEKQLGSVHAELRQKQSNLQQQQTLMQQFDTEMVFANDLFGQESQSFAQNQTGQVDLNLREKIVRIRILLENAGSVSGEEVMTEYKDLVARREYVAEQTIDLTTSSESLQTLIKDLDVQIEERFRAGMEKINTSFKQFFTTLFNGGHAELTVVNVPVGKADDEDLQEYELGVEMTVQLPNKKVSSLSMLSGGERSLTSIALLFAMSQVAPPPFIILDETDAALDEANSKRYGDMVEQLAQHSQLIVITHNRETMSRAGLLYGVTMGDDGVSRLLSVSLEEAEAVAK